MPKERIFAYKKDKKSIRYERDNSKRYINTKNDFDEARKNRNIRTSLDKMDELNSLLRDEQTSNQQIDNNTTYLEWSEWLIFDPKYITQKDAWIYWFNTKETTNTQKDKPWYQSLQEAEQSLDNQIDWKYDKKLYQEGFTKKTHLQKRYLYDDLKRKIE